MCPRGADAPSYTADVSAPSARTNIDRFWLEAMDARPDLGGVVYSAVAPDLVERVRNSSRLAWTPIEDFDALRRPALEHLGEADFQDLMRELTRVALDHPLFQALGESVMRLYGRTPTPLLGGFARVWGVLFRGCGKYRCLTGEDQRGEIRIADAPPTVRDADVLRLLHRGMLAAVVDIGGGHEAHVTERRDGDDVVFDLRWRE